MVFSILERCQVGMRILGTRQKRAKKKKRRPKSRQLKLAEFGGVYLFYMITRLMPMWMLQAIAWGLGNFAFLAFSERRRIAVENVRYALKGRFSERQLWHIARRSIYNFFLIIPEVVKHKPVLKEDKAKLRFLEGNPELAPIFEKVRRLHKESKGCIFVTPHLGNWELLPFVSTAFGIPVAIPVRPLDNEYLERFIYRSRSESGQMFIPNRNSFLILQRCLAEGRSVGLLPDQSTKRGLLVDFFGRPAYTTPIPATLAVIHRRPIVVIACCRIGRLQFTGYASDPIWPQDYEDESTEIMRLSQLMNREMEKLILRHPEQYLWMHNRWKRYKRKSRRERRLNAT